MEPVRHTPRSTARSLRAATREEPPLTAPGEKPAQPETQQSRKEKRKGTSSLPLFPAENSCLGAGRTHKVHGPAAENSWVTRKRHQFKHRSWRLAGTHTRISHITLRGPGSTGPRTGPSACQRRHRPHPQVPEPTHRKAPPLLLSEGERGEENWRTPTHLADHYREPGGQAQGKVLGEHETQYLTSLTSLSGIFRNVFSRMELTQGSPTGSSFLTCPTLQRPLHSCGMP